MITIRQSVGTGLETIDEYSRACWIDVTDPTPDEVKDLVGKWTIPQDFITFSLDPDEIPIVEKAEGALLIVARIPHFQSHEARIPYITSPLGLIVTGQRLITVCRYDHDLLHDLPEEHRRNLSTDNCTRFVLHFLWAAANVYLRHVNEINRVVEQIEERIERSLQNREVLTLLRYQKSLVHFTTALQANQTMLERLKKGQFLKLDIGDEDLLDDVFTETRQAIGMTEIASGILIQMMDAFATIISNNLNVVMKFLASITVVLIVPTIIGTFYGMNVHLPFEDSRAGFAAVVALSILCSLIVLLIFRRKNWL